MRERMFIGHRDIGSYTYIVYLIYADSKEEVLNKLRIRENLKSNRMLSVHPLETDDIEDVVWLDVISQ